MNIAYLGHACFAITSSVGIKIVTDPYQGVGYEMPQNVQADIVTVSHEHFDHNYLSAVQGEYLVVKGEGEWKERGIVIRGKNTFHDDEQGRLRGNNTVFMFIIDGIRVTHLGDLGESCTQSVLNKIGETDVLLIPIGGKYTIDALQAKTYIENIRPKVAIAMHYKPEQGTLDISAPDAFLSLFHGVIQAKGTQTLVLEDAQTTKIVFMQTGENICLKI